ncbi:hypothetical protein [Halioxenophilus sp. WMMB6]|uniref:hypothetical protein n=1 Tax=Halioxenophilus sp. WMMB6 TaxID=3073815 RepID=UPI00295EE984|nr:hypothetical protein [Halioxenophilus sp. WMMB6]
MDKAYYEADYQQALAYLEQLTIATGGDYEQQLLKAELLFNLGERKQYDKLLIQLISQQPANEDLFLSVLGLFTVFDRFEEAVLVLDILEKDFSYRFDLDLLRSVDEFQALAESKAFQNWLASR